MSDTTPQRDSRQAVAENQHVHPEPDLGLRARPVAGTGPTTRPRNLSRKPRSTP